jgi:Response regulators consisting of a CheY-like receiver domain and a winged-helix DNA-binding domain
MSSPKILVVDDQPVNVQLLRRKLEREGIQVSAAYTGQEALELVRQTKPDLILLDVMMPDMDGIDVCQRLQESEDTRSIPVIFITARTSKESKLEGLAVGAVDYITKPIDLDETLARVQTQLRFVAINREMIDLQRRLQESRRAATVGAVTQGIAHNLNNLLGVVLGYLDLIKAHPHKADFVKKNAEHVEAAVQRIVNIIKQLSTLVVKSRPPMLKFSLQRLIDDGINRYQNDFKITQPVIVNNPLGDQLVETHVEIFEDIVAKLLINAWESYGHKPANERPIEITTRLVDMTDGAQAVEIRIEDRGNGISPKIRDTMFEPFVSTKETVGVGMGLTVARHALRNLGGEISLVDRPGGGSSTILIHPLEKRIRKSVTEPPFA